MSSFGYKETPFRKDKQQIVVLNTLCPLQGRGNSPSVLKAWQLEGATLDQDILLSSRQTLGENHPLSLFVFVAHLY